MDGSSWVLLALASKHREVSLRQLDIDRSTWVLVARHRQVHLGSRCHQLSACCCLTGLRCCTLKEKKYLGGTRKRMWTLRRTKNRRDVKFGCTIQPYRRNCWSLCRNLRLYLGVRRQRTSGKWTHRTRGSLGWYPRRSQTCKNQLSVQHLWERRRISSEHEELVWGNNGSITLLIFHFHFAGIWAVLITSPHFPA